VEEEEGGKLARVEEEGEKRRRDLKTQEHVLERTQWCAVLLP
jgi:hypothetical protein